MSDKPYVTMVEAVALILTEHPDGMTLSEIQDSPLWATVSGSWQRGVAVKIFGYGPTLYHLLGALNTRSSQQHGAEPIGRSSNDFMQSHGRWTPTASAIRIADAVRPKLSRSGR